MILKCQLAKSNTMPSVTWFKDGKKLTDESNQILITHDSNQLIQLVIISAKFNDSGEYTCQV